MQTQIWLDLDLYKAGTCLADEQRNTREPAPRGQGDLPYPFQDPVSSQNPIYPLSACLAEPSLVCSFKSIYFMYNLCERVKPQFYQV